MQAPEAIQNQIDKANALHTKVYGEQKAQEEETDIDVINSLPGVEADPEPEPVIEPETVVEPESEPEGGDPSPAAPAEAAGTTDEEGKFEQRYKVLQGKYNKEVPVLNTQVKELQTELTSMRELLSSLEQIKPLETQPGSKLLKDEEVEDYGQDMIDVMKRAAREDLMPMINRLELENEQLRNSLSGVSESVSVNARDVLYRSLNIEVPNWKEINQDTGFLEWLDGVDAYSDTPKGAMLTQAFEDNNAARVIAFFKGYINENALVSENTLPPAPTEPKIDMMSMAAPGAPRGAPAPAAHSDKRVYSHADIAQFYRNVQKGLYKNNQAEKEAIERDILTAGPEGRLR